MNHFLTVSLLALICMNHCVSCPISGLIWNSTAEEFILISSIDIFSQIHNMNGNTCHSEYYDLEQYDINGTNIRVSGYEQKGVVMFYNNNTKISGTIGDIWTLLSEYLHFEMILTKLESEIFTIVLSNNGNNIEINSDYIRDNNTDVLLAVSIFADNWDYLEYTEPMYKQNFRLYTRRHFKVNKTWLFQLFNWQVWALILIIFIVFTSTDYFFRKLSSRISKTRKENLPPKDHLFYNFAIICNQGDIPDDFESSRILRISISLFSVLILLAYSSQLTSHMTQKSYIPPFVDLETLYADTTYKVIAFENSVVYQAFQLRKIDIYRWISDQRRVSFISRSDSKIYLTCSDSKEFAIFKANDDWLTRNCNVEPIGEKYFENWMAAALPKGYKYRRIFNRGLRKLREFGFFNLLLNRWIQPKIGQYDTFEFISVTIYHVEIIFSVLIYGMIISLIILVIENIMFLVKYQ
ncbi:Ionotropic receptor 107 [Cephus cinctus]|uniref:Uncharacterized protein LOC107267299 isoform X1 n=2 Tax=Cephus cinctus TaxID=211228 RepID=A0A3L9LSU9_CEPCN|nr:uncharacterized protein LOC107267299 isoform X1 [Cephus cinctus]RLZ02201.1 Ionotropic receptor 107 [Cephus cinctus]